MKEKTTKGTRCEKARAIPIERALAKLGHFPVSTTGKDAWYLSPFRIEAQASFKVSKSLNRWYDHGVGIGGNVIDLIVRIKDCPVREALDFLEGLPPSFSFRQQPLEHAENEGHIEIIRVQELHHFAVIDYLGTRSIPLGTARTFCKEVHYSFRQRCYFAIGLRNDSGGWELRNKYCKNSTSPKDISHFNYGRDRLVVVEGMFDLLSLASHDPSLKIKVDFLILNSLSFWKKALELFRGYSTVELYLDNDRAGKETAVRFMENHQNCTDRSDLYEGYKDLNEMWIGRKR